MSSALKETGVREPIISIGNIAMGGRGKTPTAALVARLLIDAGERPAILSRGYGRERPVDGAVIVSDGRQVLAGLAEGGDEPLMLARDVPGAAVVVCDSRAIAAALASHALGATVHLLDDGFQHRALRRDVDIVIITPEDLDDRRVPFGRLRASVSSLAKADAIVVDGDATEALVARLHGGIAPSAMVFTLSRRLGAPVPIDPLRQWPPAPVPVVALAGIAQPERFTRMLVAAGWVVADTLSFRDHHRYRPRDLTRLARVTEAARAEAVLTTAKDAIRLAPLGPLPVPVAAVPLEVSIEPAAAFRAWLLARVKGARG